MKNDFFHDLYMSIRDVRVRDCSAMSLSHLLHGYLSVYAMVRVSPVLEREYGTLQEIHERLREIAKELSKTMKDTSIELDERIGYMADLMDAYQTYSDMDLLNEALDVAYWVLTVDEKGEIVMPDKTPNVCRLLCNWYYFTGEEWCLEMAEGIMEECSASIKLQDKSMILMNREYLQLWRTKEIYATVMKDDFCRKMYFESMYSIDNINQILEMGIDSMYEKFDRFAKIIYRVKLQS